MKGMKGMKGMKEMKEMRDRWSVPTSRKEQLCHAVVRLQFSWQGKLRVNTMTSGDDESLRSTQGIRQMVLPLSQLLFLLKL
jgi:hypothetical protein